MVSNQPQFPGLSPTLGCMVTFLSPAPGEKDNVCCAKHVKSTSKKIHKAWAGRQDINTNYNISMVALLLEAHCIVLVINDFFFH